MCTFHLITQNIQKTYVLRVQDSAQLIIFIDLSVLSKTDIFPPVYIAEKTVITSRTGGTLPCCLYIEQMLT